MTDKKGKLHPLVSIVIPVYNGADYLGEAIDSALNQSYPNCEVIVVNDGSTDNGATHDIAVTYGDHIKYFEKENGGVATALNLAIHNAQGEYISWLSHDDLYFPVKIERQMSFLVSINKKDVILYSDFEAIDMERNELYRKRVCHLDPYDYMQDIILLLFKSVLHGCSFLVPKKCFDEVGYFDERLRTTQDYDLWFRLLNYGYEFKHIPEVLLRARWHKKQGSRSMNSIHMQERNNLHLWAVGIFYNEISTFPARVAFDIINNDNKLQNKCAGYFINIIRKDKPVLYGKLCIYEKYIYAKVMIDSFLKPFRVKQTCTNKT